MKSVKSPEIFITLQLQVLAPRARFLPPELPRDYTNVGRFSIQIAVNPASIGLDVRLLRGPTADFNQDPVVVSLLEHLMMRAPGDCSEHLFPFPRRRGRRANVQSVRHYFDLTRRAETERRILTANEVIEANNHAQKSDCQQADEDVAPHLPVEFVNGLLSLPLDGRRFGFN